MSIRAAVFSLVIFAAAATAFAESEAPAVSASQLAAKISDKEEGTTFIRLKMETAGGKGPLQLQIKSRVSRGSAELVYQVLFPKERKGEAVLLRRSGGRLSGTHFTPPDSVRAISAAQMSEPLFGSDLSYEDVIDSPFAWSEQVVVGTETIDRIPCTILESKPGKGRRSSYSSVRSWIDPRRYVPLRIEKYGDGGKLVRRINATRILLDGGDSIPANLTVRGSGVTELDGSRIKRGVAFSDAEFTPEGMREITAPRNAPE